MSAVIPKLQGDVTDPNKVEMPAVLKWIAAIISWLEIFVREQSATVESGTIIRFASDFLPDGYLACDGEEYQIKDFPILARRLGDIWGSASEGSFKVPSIASDDDSVYLIKI